MVSLLEWFVSHSELKYYIWDLEHTLEAALLISTSSSWTFRGRTGKPACCFAPWTLSSKRGRCAQSSGLQLPNTAHRNQDKRGGHITEPQKQPATQHPNTSTYSLRVCLAVLLLMGFQQFLGKHHRKLRKCYCVLRAAGARAAPWTQERGLQDTTSPAPYVQQQHLCNPLKRQPRFFFIFYFLKLTRISYFCCCHSHKLGINPMQSEPDVL